MRIVIELKRGENAEVLLNNLYKQTQMQTVFGVNVVALVDGQPRTLSLRDLLECFLRHRRDVVTRRTSFQLRKARSRAHLLEGLAVALANIDPIIALIKSSPTPADAKEKLLQNSWDSGVVSRMLAAANVSAARPLDLSPDEGISGDKYRLSERQAKEILEMRLQRLTALEQEKIVAEYAEILEQIAELIKILEQPERLMQVIREELEEVNSQYGDVRRTEISEHQEHLSLEDLIPREEVVVTLSHAGYAKSQSVDVYRAQRRGGKGKTATTTRDEDFVDKLFVANTHDLLLCFSSQGKVYWLKVYEVPRAGRTARGRPLVNLLPLVDSERVTAVLPIKQFTPDQFVVMATSSGIVKKTPLANFSRPRPSGIIATTLLEGEQLIGAVLTDGQSDVMLVSSGGKAIRFGEQALRSMGRSARGVRGIRLKDGQNVIALIPLCGEGTVVIATANGYGKRTLYSEFPVKGRGGQGVIAIQANDRNGDVIGAGLANAGEDIMLITGKGILVRTPAANISVIRRNTQGLKLIALGVGEQLIGLETIPEIIDVEKNAASIDSPESDETVN